MHPDWPWHLVGGVGMTVGAFIVAYALIAYTFEHGLSTQAWLRWGGWRDPPDELEP